MYQVILYGYASDGGHSFESFSVATEALAKKAAEKIRSEFPGVRVAFVQTEDEPQLTMLAE